MKPVNYDHIENIFNACNTPIFGVITQPELAEAIESGQDLEDFISEAYLKGNYDQIDILYYDNAIKYLAKNDPSFKESLELADDMGYRAKDLDSELLASMLATSKESGLIRDAAQRLVKYIESLED